MKEEVMRIIKLVEEGKIDSEKAAELIEALKIPQTESKVTDFQDGQMLKVKVLSAQNDNVNIKLPIKFIKGVLASCGKIPINVNGMESIDTSKLLEAIDSGLTGKIVEVQSSNGDIVEVVIE